MHRTKGRWSGAIALFVSLGLLLTACSRVGTEIVVVVDSDMALGIELDGVEIRTRDASMRLISSQRVPLGDGNPAHTLPGSFGVVPTDNDATRPAVIEIDALRGACVLMTFRARTGFLPNRRLRLDAFLARDCTARDVTGMCPPPPTLCADPSYTCTRSGVCVPESIDPMTLGDFDGALGNDAGSVDTGASRIDVASDRNEGGADVSLDVERDVALDTRRDDGATDSASDVAPDIVLDTRRDDGVVDTGTDIATDRGAADVFMCMSHAECDDGIFCNGVESCMRGAGPTGCIPMSSGPCAMTDVCNEATRQCLPIECMVRDADRDGHDQIACGGDDCDDTNALRFPGRSDPCDDGVDNDCNPMTGDTIVGSRCGSNVGACFEGVWICASSVVTCTGRLPVAEMCNDLDDDCNNDVDDAIAPRTCGTGACERTVAGCIAGTIPPCTPGMPIAEICDNVDNDCDSMTDEGLTNGVCGIGTGPCVEGTSTCVAGNFVCMGGVGPTPETCNMIDDNCDGETDEDPNFTLCSLPGATSAFCAAGECRIGTCADGFGDCDGAPLNGCEAPGSTDPMNCGFCGAGVMCSVGNVCVSGACQCEFPCMAGQTLCSGQCVNVASNPLHCGVCGNACGNGEACSGGLCVCSAPRTSCGGLCTNTFADPQNCGACGNSCRLGQVCDAGTCLCPPGLAPCGGECVVLDSDRDNCGACGVSCSPAFTCAGGQCRSGACPVGTTDCDRSCLADLQNPEHCGACNRACPPGSLCAGGSCVCSAGFIACSPDACIDVSSDRSNCGGCGNRCASGAFCRTGMCECPSGTTSCASGCVDTSSDELNCGGCGNRCNPGSPCCGGMCR